MNKSDRSLPLCRQLKIIREERGLSLIEAAKRAGINKSSLSRLEAGLTEPTIATIRLLSEVLRFEFHIEGGRLYLVPIE